MTHPADPSTWPPVLLGLIGKGIGASRTPALHEREGAAQGLRTIYRLIDLDRLNLPADALPELLTAAERTGFAGLNITHPCKQAVLPLLHELSDDARALGAVNTVVTTPTGGASPRVSGAACPTRRATVWCRSAPAGPGRRSPTRC